ncbi:MAG: hypothetical protein WC505_04430 [Patescibacteria group bacterium]
MTEKKTSFDSLFSDSGPFDENEVIQVLHDHVTIQRSSNKIFFKDTDLSVTKKILVYGLAKKLLKMKGLSETDLITAQEFREATRISKGTIDPAFKTLKDKGLLVGKREYEIPTSRVASIAKLISSRK